MGAFKQGVKQTGGNDICVLSGPTATVILSRYAVALHSVALRFPGFGGGGESQENRATPPEKGPVAPTFAALEGGVVLQVASRKVSRCRGVSQLHSSIGVIGKSALEIGQFLRRLNRGQAPTMYWQAIAARNLVVLQQGGDVAFV